MNPLLISGFGTSINVDKRKLIINNKLKNQKLEFYPHQIKHDSIIVDGHTGNITFEAMRWLMKHNVQLTLLNWNGNLLAATLPQPANGGKLKIKQYQKYLDNKTRFKVAQKFVDSKINSSQNLLKELSKYYPLDISKLGKTIEKEYQNYEKTLQESNKPVFTLLLALEGRVAQLYFGNLSKIFLIIAPEFHFERRWVQENRRNYNAADEVNALLNYGYAVLESEIKKTINTAGLDSQVGFLHELTLYSTPLVYDLQELFRWLIDLSVIQLMENKRLQKSNFIVTENYHLRLREKTAKMLIEKIKHNFNRKVPYKNKNYSYQTILNDAVQQLTNFVYGKKKEFEFEVPVIQIQREDSLDIREKILKMTPDQRRKFGINKSTLWYMKKNLKSGKNIKIYDKTFSKINSK